MGKAILYVKDGCPYCAKMIKELQEKGLDYEEKNVSHDAEALREAKEEYKADKVPVLVQGEKVTIGYGGGRQG